MHRAQKRHVRDRHQRGAGWKDIFEIVKKNAHHLKPLAEKAWPHLKPHLEPLLEKAKGKAEELFKKKSDTVMAETVAKAKAEEPVKGAGVGSNSDAINAVNRHYLESLRQDNKPKKTKKSDKIFGDGLSIL